MFLGQYLKAGDNIVRLEDTSVMKIRFTVAQTELAKIKVGQQLDIMVDAYPQRPFEGTIAAIEPAVKQLSGVIEVQARPACWGNPHCCCALRRLKALRMRWQDMTNQHLERAGVDVRIDMRSHAERKTGLEPEAEQLPSQWRGAGRENVIEFRAARVELRKAGGLLREEIPNQR